MYMKTICGAGILFVACSCGAQEMQSVPATTLDPHVQNIRLAPSEPRKMWVLPPRTAKEIREQGLRNRMSIQFVEPTYSATGEAAFRKISVNCFEPSVSIQYMENRRIYNGLYIQDFGGWSDEAIAGRRLPVDIEPSTADLQRYLQQGCSGQVYPQRAW